MCPPRAHGMVVRLGAITNARAGGRLLKPKADSTRVQVSLCDVVGAVHSPHSHKPISLPFLIIKVLLCLLTLSSSFVLSVVHRAVLLHVIISVRCPVYNFTSICPLYSLCSLHIRTWAFDRFHVTCSTDLLHGNDHHPGANVNRT